MKQEFEKIPVDKVDVEDALSCLSVIEELWYNAPHLPPEEKDPVLEFRIRRLRVCLEHMIDNATIV